MHGSGAAAKGRHTESRPADSATKDDTEVNRIEEGGSGAATKSRTRDLLITSQLLYHG